jgi:integrase
MRWSDVDWPGGFLTLPETKAGEKQHVPLNAKALAILRALGTPETPRYGHLPLVCAADGSRLAKRTPGAIVRVLRERGHSAAEIIGVLGHALGLSPHDSPCSLGALAGRARPGWLRDARELRVPERFAVSS